MAVPQRRDCGLGGLVQGKSFAPSRPAETGDGVRGGSRQASRCSSSCALRVSLMRPSAFTLPTTWSVGGHRKHAAGVESSHGRRCRDAGREVKELDRSYCFFSRLRHLRGVEGGRYVGWMNSSRSSQRFRPENKLQRVHIWAVVQGERSRREVTGCGGSMGAQRRESRSRRRRGQGPVEAGYDAAGPTNRSLDEHPWKGPDRC